MPDLTLAEIVQEGERLHAEHDAATMVRSLRTADMLARFYSAHGPALLAVAKAAVECVNDPWGGGLSALDAAVRSAKGGPDV